MQLSIPISHWLTLPSRLLVEKVAAPSISINSSDEVLIGATLGGNDNAFRILVDRFMDEVSRTVTGMLGPVAEVDDVVQEVFIKLHRSLTSFRGDSSLKTFVIRMAINKSLDALRKRKRARWLQPWSLAEDQDPVSSANSDGNIESVERKRELRRAIDRLPDNQKAVIVLRMIEDLSTQETATALNLPYGTVLSRLKRGLDRLKSDLESSTWLD
ncbi:MAG: RNA polymerase sigma factor [Bacteroidetes Order II. Incertae sedis bacterium]|nr:RNA polymerase sigma factor [Bacteroidetes Order II. bacterium]MBT5249005.1 RNA polymerase sigma factor [Bacteroidetes Order II. bacterium]MBT6201082.1 RNA polymerase sigma factor [Bacteroidetes Order II. bacterium]MBT6425712.1 RNA polymerase sigma factor [Bacteroidetes Order II. bacterium]MBT6599152.1 RNA polymerase sigma factor [Bacteroidetes Order II. bacterium]